jgi:hypothetical protein
MHLHRMEKVQFDLLVDLSRGCNNENYLLNNLVVVSSHRVKVRIYKIYICSIHVPVLLRTSSLNSTPHAITCMTSLLHHVQLECLLDKLRNVIYYYTAFLLKRNNLHPLYLYLKNILISSFCQTYYSKSFLLSFLCQKSTLSDKLKTRENTKN